MSYRLRQSQEEFDGMLKQVFEVRISPDFNPNSIPQDGVEYLQHVVYERNQCKKTAVTTDIDPRNFDKNQTLSIQLETFKKAPDSVLPSKTWQENTCKEFGIFRRFIESKTVPSTHISYFNEDNFIKRITSTVPTFTKFMKYSHPAKIRMLEVITTHLDSLNINDSLGYWIFAILSTIEIPLSANDCHIIRDLAKKFIDIRATSQDSEISLLHCQTDEVGAKEDFVDFEVV